MAIKYKLIFKNENITLSKHPEREEYWLYDYTRGHNLSMGAKSEQEAFVESLKYYQKRLTQVENNLKETDEKIQKLFEIFAKDED